MNRQELADFLYWLLASLALIMVVVSIFDGLEGWRIALNCLLFVVCAAGLIVRKLERRKKKNNLDAE